MKGTIKLYNINSQNGTILGYDAKKYMFSKDDFLQEINIKEGMNVDFEIHEDTAKKIYVLNVAAINVDGSMGFLLGGVCFLVPIVGIVLNFLWVNKMPKKAKHAMRLALFGIIAEIIILLFMFILSLSISL